MTLNAFEQLEFFVPEPKRAFGEIIHTLLQDPPGRCIRHLFEREDKTYVVRRSPGSPEFVTLYQAKYFVGRWRSCQRKELREAFQEALVAGRPLHRWVLCVPSRMAAEDIAWFEQWRASQPVGIEVLDGNELIKMLKEPGAGHALEKMQAWGTTVPGAEAPRVHGRLKVRPAEPQSGLTHYLHVSLYNGGGGPVKGLSVELAHSVTRCFRLRPDERDWRNEGEGNTNPRRFRACRPLRPLEERLLAVIPISVETPLPIGLRLKFSTEQTARSEQHLCLDERALPATNPLEFVSGAGPELLLGEAESVPVAAA